MVPAPPERTATQMRFRKEISARGPKGLCDLAVKEADELVPQAPGLRERNTEQQVDTCFQNNFKGYDRQQTDLLVKAGKFCAKGGGGTSGGSARTGICREGRGTPPSYGCGTPAKTAPTRP